MFWSNIATLLYLPRLQVVHVRVGILDRLGDFTGVNSCEDFWTQRIVQIFFIQGQKLVNLYRFPDLKMIIRYYISHRALYQLLLCKKQELLDYSGFYASLYQNFKPYLIPIRLGPINTHTQNKVSLWNPTQTSYRVILSSTHDRHQE